MIAGPALNNDGDALSGIPIVAYQSTLKATRSGLTGFLMIQRGLDEPREQGVGLGRAGLELRVSLGADIERVHILRQLDELGELAVRALTGNAQAPLAQEILVATFTS